MQLYLRPFLLFSCLVSAQTGQSVYKKRLTGEDLDTSQRWSVAGTDLGIPYVLENGAIGFLFGDTFSTQWPDDGQGWRSPIMLRSAINPGEKDGIIFDSAAGVAGDGFAPEITHNGHQGDDGAGTWEYTVIPNDGIGFNETGEQIVSYMSIKDWSSPWSTNYAGLAHSKDGNTFTRLDTKWLNDGNNADPFQMWTMQRDGDWVYVFSVRAGRQSGPMMLQRVPWDKMAQKDAYEGWGWDGTDWQWGRPCSPILEGTFGEPSVRKLKDGTWAMVYLNLSRPSPTIVSRTAAGPDKPWSDETVQVTWEQEESLYGGFIHPWSTSKENELYLMVSKWSRDPVSKHSTAYHVSQYVGTL
ncbi:hypothetical protein EYZ11_000855 [Aspergillus tanneri]|uniref:DUF4185 domain-containing protein n=1 Tax=Aspergillus tanneri TaxID=1220188 RepID=A0A4S3JW46_9EURO|nr:uncharacterized protein ATNIH1004_003129 [Aspergillus tanneri]KAA8650443.1 hypothetical protein ATNIH1004_003129 [Aspergillus tanneri]THC99694.1 hypothetical protein EYZ11_000855 [Aspergillus tanneri]